MNEEAIDLLIQKHPDLNGCRDKLEAMTAGAYCMHRSWGFGRIKEYDASSNRLIIDFEEKPGHPMDPVFCVDKLDILEDNNILVRQQQDPDAIKEMMDKHPADLIVEILRHCPDQAASTAEIENLLRKLLEEKKFKSWWTKTKKALVKDPRVATPSKKHEPYILRDEPLTPEQEILEEFYFIKNPLKKIQLAEKLHELSDNVDEIRQDLPQILETLTTAIREARQLNQAERLHGCWVRNNLARHLEREKLISDNGGVEPENLPVILEEVVDALEPTSKSLVLETENLSELAENLPSSYQKRFLDLITRVYPEEWQGIIIQLLRNSTGKFTGECITFMVDRKEGDLVHETLLRWLKEQNMKAPVLLWVVKNRHSRKFKKLVDTDLVNHRLLGAIFYAIDNEALQSTTNKRIPLADVLSDDQELIPYLLADANQETARDLAQTLMLNQGFEDLTKKSLLARFIKQFPKIQSLVDSDAQTESEQLMVSADSYERRKQEYEHLINVEIPQNKEAIAIAKEHGDLKENSEYKMARQDQDTLLARRANLERDLERARVTDFTDATIDNISIGTVVELEQGTTGKTHTYAILGAWDSDPENDIISYKTPLGQNLLSHSPGETINIEIAGVQEAWTIKSIKRWVDVRQ